MEENIIGVYKELGSINKVAKQLRISNSRVTKILKMHGLVKKCTSSTSGRKPLFSIDSSFFEVIDTQEKAYVLGFLYADGNMSNYSNAVGFTLKRSDSSILEDISRVMKSTYKLRQELGRYSSDHPTTEKIVFRFCNKKMYSDLLNLGCKPNKGDTLIFPSISEHLLSHFMRGYFDGDGTVFIASRCNQLRFGIISTYEFCKKYLENLNLERITICKEKRSSKNVYYFTIAKELEVQEIYRFLYKDATIFLKRKKEKFDNYYLTNGRSSTIIETPEKVMV